MAENKIDKVGYKNPPKRTRFKKGASGNPKGRPKKRVGFHEAFAAVLARQIAINENGQRKYVNVMEALASQCVAQALKGDSRTLGYLMKTLPAMEPIMKEIEETDISPSDYEKMTDAELDHLYRKMLDKS